MVIWILSKIVRLLVSLRYRIRLHGWEEIRQNGGKGILFLPNHPALIDPPIVASTLSGKFHPCIMVEEKQVRETVMKHFVKEWRLLSIPDLGVAGESGFDRVHQQLKKCLEVLESGENVLMYPGGHIYHSRFETLRGNMGAHYLVTHTPGVRVVLIRTRGLWGSSFGRSSGYQRPFAEILHSHLKHILQNLIFFSPRRNVDITFTEITGQIPENCTKEQFNRKLEEYYNTDAEFNTYVPYTWWEKGGIRTLPEPPSEDVEVDTRQIPPEVREKVYGKLREMTPVTEIGDSQKLGADLGLDSLMIYEVLVWVQQEFGQQVNNPENLKRVADVLLAAVGQTVSVEQLRPVPLNWFIPPNPEKMVIPPGCPKLTDTYLKLAGEQPDFPLLADQNSGVLTNRTIILSILALKGVFEKLPGDRIGIIMPACAAIFPVCMAVLYAGKTPVMLNWTVGPRNLLSCVKRSGIHHILTSGLVIEKLEGRGTDFSGIRDKFLFLEDLKKQITTGAKLLALLRSRFCWHSLRTAKVPETAAILFTSGSESEPKAVPLTHQNFINNIQYSMDPMNLRKDDCILGMLPPFHSFGLLISVVMPSIANMRIVYHSNPTEANMLGKIIGAYQPTMIVGTPTFAGGILRCTEAEHLKSIRIIITGAEKCPQTVLDLCHGKCPDACFLEGYGITECSPIVAVNQPTLSRINTVGHILDCLDWKICNEAGEPLPAGETGMLFVSGPTVFGGYLEYDGPSPFVERDGKKWYRTGDLVMADAEGFIHFKGRLKRFVKIAGEMVSLPAVEELLLTRFKGEEKGVPLAVEASGPDDHPEITLFTTMDLDKNTVNQLIREAGFSPIHYVKRIVKLDEIPLLGTGKTNYRALKTIA